MSKLCVCVWNNLISIIHYCSKLTDYREDSLTSKDMKSERNKLLAEGNFCAVSVFIDIFVAPIFS